MISDVQSAQRNYLTTQTSNIQQSLSQRVGVLLQRAGVEVQGEGPIALSLDDNGNVVVGGDVENAAELLDALGSDNKLKNLLKASEMTNAQTEAAAESEEDSVAGVSKEQLAKIWDSIKEDPDGETKLAKIVDKLQILDKLGSQYTGELTADAILATGKNQAYYQDLATSLRTNMPSIFDYMSGSSAGSSVSGMLSAFGSGGNASADTSFSGILSATSSYAMSKAYSQISQSASSNLNVDA